MLRWWRTHLLGDLLVALVLLGCGLFIASGYHDGERFSLHAVVLCFVFLPLAIRSRARVAVYWIVGCAILVNLALGFHDSFFETFAWLLALYTVVAYEELKWPFWITIAGAFVGVHAAVAIGWYNQGIVYWGDLPYNWLLFILPLLVGYGVRTRRAYVAQLEERTRLQGREAANEERSRIARELHDVVAHSVTVMVLQAAAGARVARRDPAEAAMTFDVIERTGRDALAELRRALGVLRLDGDDGDHLLPQPRLDQMDSFLEPVRRAGIAVELEISGQQRPLPAGVEVSICRIVQEALTNVLKHASASRAEVRLSYAANDLVVDVYNDGAAVTNSLGGMGQGVAGMRERVLVVGGELEAGPVAGGYRVRAHVPITPVSS